MHIFSAKISDKKIEMFIPDDILRDAKRIFKHLRKTAIAEAYEVVESAESSAKLSHHSCIFSPRLVSAWR